MINHKWISTGQIKYLINKVLIPRLEYRLMITALKNKVCEKLFRSVVQLAKRKFQLPSTIPNCLIFHEDIIGIKGLWERYTEHHITEWLIRLNEGGLVIQTTIGRLNQAQIDMLSSKPIWELDTESIESWNSQNNINATTFVIARKLDLDIVNSVRSEAFKQAKHPNVRDFREILGNNLDKKTIKRLKKLDIMYLEQLLSARGLYMITWSQLKRNKKLSTRGRKVVWFKKLEDILIFDKARRNLKPEFMFKGQYNPIVIKLKLKEISKKRSKKEWVITNEEMKKN